MIKISRLTGQSAEKPREPRGDKGKPRASAAPIRRMKCNMRDPRRRD
jgi:hypothetical protein